MDTKRIMNASKGTRLGINLNSKGQCWFQCLQLLGSDLAAGALKMMTALLQRRRNSHFSGDCEPAVAPSHPWGGNYGPWLQEKKAQTSEVNHLRAGKVWISPPVCEGAELGFMNIGLSNKICFFLHLPSSSSFFFFWDLILLQPSLTSDLRPLDLTHLLRWSSLRSIMAFFPLTSSS